MSAIFISYRRQDAEGQAGRLFEDLAAQFGKDLVFMDVAGIEPGRDFRKVIDANVARCGVLLAIIGKEWLTAADETGRRRIDDPHDFVRIETVSALKRDIPVIPVMVRGALMPRADQLPPELADLAFRNAVELTHARWDSDVKVLISALERYVVTETDGEAATRDPDPEAGTRRSRRKGAGNAAASGMAPRFGLKSLGLGIGALVAAGGLVVGYQHYTDVTETQVKEAARIDAEKKAAEEKVAAYKAAAERGVAENAAADKAAVEKAAARQSSAQAARDLEARQAEVARRTALLADPSKLQGFGTDGRRVSHVSFGQPGQVLGTFAQSGQAAWVERNAQGTAVFKFREVGRDDWSVYLSDDSRGIRLQLDLHTRKVNHRYRDYDPYTPLYSIVMAK